MERLLQHATRVVDSGDDLVEIPCYSTGAVACRIWLTLVVVKEAQEQNQAVSGPPYILAWKGSFFEKIY